MNLKRKIMTGLAATAVAFSGLGLSTATADPGSTLGPQAASAAVYGKPGCITKAVFKPSYVNRNGVLIYESYCTYRTSLGTIIYNYKTGGYYAKSTLGGFYQV